MPLLLQHWAGKLLLGCLIVVLLTSATPVRADEGWVINSFDASIQVQPDGTLNVQETLLVDFRSLEKHGIFRDIPVVYAYDSDHQRVYEIAIRSVTDISGQPHQYETSREGSFLRVKIGDPDTTIVGEQSYIISYDVSGALNSFPEHDELFWNATGPWPVALDHVSVSVELPRDGIQRIACFQGTLGSTELCSGVQGGNAAVFSSTRVLPEQHQLTFVVGFDKGIVPEQVPRLERRLRDFQDFFVVTSVTVGASATVLAGVAYALGWAWWNHGRDRRYVTIHYLTNDPREETAPLLAKDPVVIEYEPPEQLRPAALGVLIDERADTLDATATIIDLAVRGHLHITEVDKKFLGVVDLGGNDWRFTRKHNPEDQLLPYEAKLLEGLFQDGDEGLLSDLKTKFHTHLNAAQDLLYEDAHQRKFFPKRPDQVRTWWVAAGAVTLGSGVVLLVLLGALFGFGIVALPIIAGGVITMVMAGAMPRRTALGREMLRRTLGFHKYLAAAETSRQRYHEEAKIFATYLPYAMVFGCVDIWATELSALAAAEGATGVAGYYGGWYTGNTLRMNPGAFSDGMRGLSSDISKVIVSTPGGSGSSGFGGGGFSGGGGGGGGGGSW